jgi:hypothetical protein
MIIEVTRSIFIDQFRAVRPDNFNYAGLNALYDYYEQYQEDTGEEIELDVIALCCDFCQYDSIEEVCKAYDLADREELEENTIIIDCDDESVIIQNF